MSTSDIRLTEYSHGAGCGCKISPQVLDSILASQIVFKTPDALLVGNSTKDDAAAYDLGDGQVILSTTDFFMPIVDDPFDFGRIAATNAISDIYAMGGEPLLAIAILGWPVNVLSPDVAREVVEGGRQACADAGIPLAGGHSIDAPEPIFGLAVTGRVDRAHLKRNDTARAGDLLYLTKPLGIGILTTAQKKKLLSPAHAHIARDLMVELNTVGGMLATLPGVHAMTDVTGFGLMGHLVEICEGSGLQARIRTGGIPVIPEAVDYAAMGCIPGGTVRNHDSYGRRLENLDPAWKPILCDPQTSGGLLICVSPDHAHAVEQLLGEQGLPCAPMGVLESPEEALHDASPLVIITNDASDNQIPTARRS